jgi:hypothetical protein
MVEGCGGGSSVENERSHSAPLVLATMTFFIIVSCRNL